MPSNSRPLLSHLDVRKSQLTSVGTSVQIKKQDALKFLSKLDTGSVDLIISSPPYCMGKAYEDSTNTDDFLDMHDRLAPLLARVLKDGGSLCWQVGHHVHNGVVTPLDALVYMIFSKQKDLFLRNRIVWTFAHGVHANRRFSGRHETVLWFTKGSDYVFDLDAVRVPQKYPGKRHYKGPKKGEYSGNPLGKNPSDVWEIPNVKANHVEKTDHPCQFPVALPQRLVRALTTKDAVVCDPFLGSGSSAVAACLEGRNFIGCEIQPEYVAIARKRVANAKTKNPRVRPASKPIFVPTNTLAVATRPAHFKR